MAEFKLPYTANEISEKLGKVDNLVATINGSAPDANGNVEVTSGGIIDVLELPTENINENAFYRLMTAKFISNYYTAIDNWICYCVNGLPSVGESVSIDMVNITAYYNIQDGEVYGYADDAISSAGNIPVGWYSIGTLSQAFGVTWGGITTDADDIDNSAKVLLTYDFYLYKNGWSLIPFAYEKAPAFDIQWDGDMTDRSALDMSALGYSSGVYFVKVSDDVFTTNDVLGGTIELTSNDGSVESGIITQSNIDTTTYPGAFTISSCIVVMHDDEALATALGIPTGIYTNGVYFWLYTEEGYTSRFIAPAKITKINGKYIDASSINAAELDGLARVAISGSYNDLWNQPIIYTDVVRYTNNQGLTSSQKSYARSNIDVYSKSEVDTKIANTDVVRYNTTQILSYTQKLTARTNIDVYSKSEVDTKIANAGTSVDLSEYAKTTDVETMINEALGVIENGSY